MNPLLLISLTHIALLFVPSLPPSLPLIAQVGVVTFWLVAAAIGCKSEDMVEVCGWMFVVLNIFVLAFVFRNLALGIRNVNQEPVRCCLHALVPTTVGNPVVCALQVFSPLYRMLYSLPVFMCLFLARSLRRAV